jgi:7-carboxy-7-deazaguanine synthase
MPLLRLNEHYTSVQGEGPNVGLMTQFVRFSGCNMRCPGWPCDTQHAIQPALWKDDPKLTPSELFDAVAQEFSSTGAKHVCITGGEPFMQDEHQLEEFVRTLFARNYTIDVFTNGSYTFPSWVLSPAVTVIMDWKLSGSGEAGTRLRQRHENALMLHQKDAIKFVVKTFEDLREATGVWANLLVHASYFVGRVWDAEITDDDLVEYIKERKLPWRLNIQVHKLIWPNVERGI